MATQRQVERALERFEEDLSRYPNVVGLGILPLDESAPDPDAMAIAVYVSHKVPESRLAKRDRIPKSVEIEAGGRALRIPTRVIEQGEVTLE
jgi:hypothetical protein